MGLRQAGRKLAELHLGYEQLEPWPLRWIEAEGVPLSYHVEKMRLSKDKTQLKVNEVCQGESQICCIRQSMATK